MTADIRKKVLIVDDDPTTTLLIKQNVSNAGFDVETASNGKEAMEKIGQRLPDLAVIDAVMPEMNGFELSRQIRVLDPAKKIPIIMLTVLKTDPDADHAFAAGVTQFISKPVDLKALMQKILFYLRPPSA